MTQERLSEKLLEFGYELISVYKDGRNVMYELNEIKVGEWAMIQSNYNVKDKVKHSQYSRTRIQKGLDYSRSKTIKTFIEDCEKPISYNTAKKYDDILLKENIIQEKGYVYCMMSVVTGSFTQISKEEYSYYWVCNKELKRQIKDLRCRRSKYEISESAYDVLLAQVYSEFGVNEGSIAIKFMTYSEMETTMDILEQIRESARKSK